MEAIRKNKQTEEMRARNEMKKRYFGRDKFSFSILLSVLPC